MRKYFSPLDDGDRQKSLLDLAQSRKYKKIKTLTTSKMTWKSYEMEKNKKALFRRIKKNLSWL